MPIDHQTDHQGPGRSRGRQRVAAAPDDGRGRCGDGLVPGQWAHERRYVYDSWGGGVSTIDLVRRRLVASSGPVPTSAALRLPFGSDAYAKGPNFSAALSANGSTLLVLNPRGSGFRALATATTSSSRSCARRWSGQWLDQRSPLAQFMDGLPVPRRLVAAEPDGRITVEATSLQFSPAESVTRWASHAR